MCKSWGGSDLSQYQAQNGITSSCSTVNGTKREPYTKFERDIMLSILVRPLSAFQYVKQIKGFGGSFLFF